MIAEIKDAFKRHLPNLEWMDDQTRRAAVEKANAVIDKIGFPQYILNQTALDKRYEKVSGARNGPNLELPEFLCPSLCKFYVTSFCAQGP